MKTVPFYIESENGHDTMNVPFKQVQVEVEKQLKEGKWVTTEKKDGSTEILTKKDIPADDDLDEEDKKLMKQAADWKDTFGQKKTTATVTPTKPSTPSEKWESKFKSVKSAVACHKAKGG